MVPKKPAYFPEIVSTDGLSSAAARALHDALTVWLGDYWPHLSKKQITRKLRGKVIPELAQK